MDISRPSFSETYKYHTNTHIYPLLPAGIFTSWESTCTCKQTSQIYLKTGNIFLLAYEHAYFPSLLVYIKTEVMF